MSSQEEKIEWMKEHLHYEMLMLRYCIMKMGDIKTPLDWNAYYESFAVHARNIRNFLGNREGTNQTAEEYVDGFEAKAPQEIVTLFDHLNKQVYHLAKKRPTDAELKVNLERARDIFAWLIGGFSSFVGALQGTPYERHWNPDRTDPEKFDNSEAERRPNEAASSSPTMMSGTIVPPRRA